MSAAPREISYRKELSDSGNVYPTVSYVEPGEAVEQILCVTVARPGVTSRGLEAVEADACCSLVSNPRNQSR